MMLRFAMAMVMSCVACSSTAHAQSWARDLFPERTHDFGVVPRAARAEHEFTFTNTLDTEIRLRSIRTSCGCTSPVIVTKVVKPGEKGVVLAKFNSRSYLGKRRATLTLTVDKPRFAEIQLRISGYVRKDVVLDPGQIDFGKINLGQARQKKVQVRYAGRKQWEIGNIKSSNPNVQTEVTEISRHSGSVHYELTVRLNENASVGYLNDELVLETNDRLSNVRMMVTGRVEAALTVNPASIFMGVVSPGQEVTKKLLVRADRPFSVTKVGCDDDCFRFEWSSEAKKMHLIPVKFTAGSSARSVSQEIAIETDLDDGSTAICVISATVQEGLAQETRGEADGESNEQ